MCTDYLHLNGSHTGIPKIEKIPQIFRGTPICSNPHYGGNVKIYDVEELIPMLRLSRKAIRGYIAEGRLIGRKVGKRWLVSEDALKIFLLNGEERPSISSPCHDKHCGRCAEGHSL
jgi:hypothetical protein